MRKIKLALKPLQEALWRVHEPSGAEFLIAPLPAELDQDMTNQATDLMGNVNGLAFARLAAPNVIKGWRHVADGGGGEGDAVCNEASLALFVATHGRTIMPWVIRESRSLDHYRSAEVEDAKKD